MDILSVMVRVRESGEIESFQVDWAHKSLKGPNKNGDRGQAYIGLCLKD